MNEDLQKQLAESIKGFTETLSGAADVTKTFAQEQVPDIIHQYIVWGIASSVFWFFVCALIFGMYMKYAMQAKNWDGEIAIPYWIFGGCIIGAPSFFGAIAWAKEALFITVAPKVWLIQEAARLLK